MHSKEKIEMGKVIIAEPFMQDPNFHRSVILILEHNENGSFGLVLNQLTSLYLADVIEDCTFNDDKLRQGGPVDLQSLHYLHTCGYITGAIPVLSSLYWGGDFSEICEGLDTQKIDISQVSFYIGYSGWAAGQLQEELREGAWIIGNLSASDILDKKLDDDKLWQRAVQKKGGKVALLSNSPKYPNLN
jgi:putative transcriptional regulator